MKEHLYRVLKRFGKTFLAGGLAGVIVFLGNPQQLEDMNKWLVALVFAFLVSGFMAI